MALVKAGLELGNARCRRYPVMHALKNIDIKKILSCLERGAYGKLIESRPSTAILSTYLLSNKI